MEVMQPLDILAEGHLDLKNGRGLLVVGAHPDDEVIGAGGQIPFWKKATFVHVTDGAPRDMTDARREGYDNREHYAAARQKELTAALALAGIAPGQIQGLGFPDQECSSNLIALVEACLHLLAKLRPVAVLTHPYEGGHPDHDSTAFALHTARRLLGKQQARSPLILEMTSYHNEAGSMQTRHFLLSTSHVPVRSVLAREQRSLKSQMFAEFKTQRSVLQWFPIDFESFRSAPDYDFLQAPHSGQLYYELFNWGTTGREWRSAATEALRHFELNDQRIFNLPRVETWPYAESA